LGIEAMMIGIDQPHRLNCSQQCCHDDNDMLSVLQSVDAADILLELQPKASTYY
jgi:hypothetical protein